MRLLTLVVALASLGAFAQAEKKPAPRAQPAQKVQHVTFGDGSQITGEADFPEGILVESVYKPKFERMIKVRTSFADKLLDSVNEL